MNKIMLCIFLLYKCILSGQNIYNSSCDYRLSYPEFNLFIVPKLGTQQFKIGVDTIVKLNLHGCQGSSEISVYSNNNLIIRGKTLNGLRLLAKQMIIFDLISYEESINIIEYYEPIKDGLWEYWDIKGVKIKEINYQKGIIGTKK